MIIIIELWCFLALVRCSDLLCCSLPSDPLLYARLFQRSLWKFQWKTPPTFLYIYPSVNVFHERFAKGAVKKWANGHHYHMPSWEADAGSPQRSEIHRAYNEKLGLFHTCKEDDSMISICAWMIFTFSNTFVKKYRYCEINKIKYMRGTPAH